MTKGTNDEFVETIVRDYAQQAWAVAYYHCGNVQDAEDILQDVWMIARRKCESIRNYKHIWSWIAKTVFYQSRNHLRSRRRGEQHISESSGPLADTLESDHPRPDQLAQVAEVNRAVLESIHALPEFQREAVLLVRLSGLTYAEAARVLEVPEGNIKSWLNRAKSNLQECESLKNLVSDKRLAIAALPIPFGGWEAALDRWVAIATQAPVADASGSQATAASTSHIGAYLATAGVLLALMVGAFVLIGGVFANDPDTSRELSLENAKPELQSEWEIAPASTALNKAPLDSVAKPLERSGDRSSSTSGLISAAEVPATEKPEFVVGQVIEYTNAYDPAYTGGKSGVRQESGNHIVLEDGQQALHGQIDRYSIHGEVVRSEEYARGVREGKSTVYVMANGRRNGLERTERWFVQGKREGPETAFFSDGRVKSVTSYVNDLKDGTTTKYHNLEAAVVKERADYREDKLHGTRELFTKGGKLILQETWFEGLRDGPFLRKNPDDLTIVEKGSYSMGLRVGSWQIFDSVLGLELALLLDEKGNQSYSTNHANGAPHITGQVVAGLRSGEWTLLRDDGQREAVVNYKDDRTDGLFRRWHPSGVIAAEGLYQSGRKAGAWTYRYPNQRLKAVENYTIATLERSSFRNPGIPVGEWRCWLDDAKHTLVSHLIYKKGKVVKDLLNPSQETQSGQ